MAQLVIMVSADSYVRDNARTSNFGSDTPMTIGWSDGEPPIKFRTLLLFDVSSIPAGSTIDAAQLNLTTQTVAASGVDAKVHRVFNAWSESQVTWNKRTLSDWDTAGGDFIDDGTAVPFTLPTSGDKTITGLAPLVTDAINNRSDLLDLMLKRVNETSPGSAWLLHSRESGDNEPTLTVDYTLVSTRDNTLIALDGRMQNMTGGMQ